MDWNNAPKQFCDKAGVAFGEQHFLIAMLSGSQGTAYVLTPKHAKDLLKSLQHEIEKYEEKYAEIESGWEPGVKSPVQKEDLPR